MSAYTLNYLRSHSRVGDVDVNGLPWTARALGLSLPNALDDTDADGNRWLYASAVPLNVARDLLDAYAVVSHPLAFVRPANPWDDPATMVTIDGQQFTVVTDASRQIIADAKTDRVHFVPKEGYTVHPFSETLLDRTARIVGESNGDLHIDSVGVLADGGEAWVSISTGSLSSTPEGVSFYSHVLGAGSHNGTLSSTLCAVNTLTVCDNTRAMALGEGKANGTMTKAKHTRYSAAKLADQESEARAAMGLLVESNEAFQAEVARLCAIPVSDAQFSAWITSEVAPLADDASKNAITRAEREREMLAQLWNADARVSPWKGTAWGALQAVNTADEWERATRGGTDQKARIMREAITGKLAERESDHAASLAKVLANV